MAGPAGELRQYEMVRVVRLNRPADAYNWGPGYQRSPQVGDVGCIVEIYQTPGVPETYVVESVAPDGRTVWLADFTADEIEPVGSGRRHQG